ncbi:unnamed protein product [Sympodiomycopsis kandeliae]
MGTNGPSKPASTTSSKCRLAKFYAIISLVILAVQNTSLALVLHASRVAPQDGKDGDHHDRGAYFTPSAVLCTEIAKTFICAILLLWGIARAKATKQLAHSASASQHQNESMSPTPSFFMLLKEFLSPSTLRHAISMVFSESAWPLSFPAILYVLQNNLQYAAAENLEPAVFQTLYQLKILTTALFSRILLGKKLHRKQWIALLILAIGVAIVQVGSQSSHGGPHPLSGGAPAADALPSSQSYDPLPPSAHSHAGGAMEEYASLMAEEIAAIERRMPPPPPPPFPQDGQPNGFLYPPPPPPPPSGAHHYPGGSPLLGFLAVLSACVTSGLAGVWFEKVVKGGACGSKDQPTAHQDRSAPATHTRSDSITGSYAASKSISRSRSPQPLPSDHCEQSEHYSSPSSSSSGSSSSSNSSSHSNIKDDLEWRSGNVASTSEQSSLDLPSSCTVWLSALQLSLFSLAPALVPVLVKMYASNPDTLSNPGLSPDFSAPWRNFGSWAWGIVALQTIGGLVTACVVRWADNILKCFAVAFALLITSVLSIPLFQFQMTPSFIIGAGLTIVATLMYQRVQYTSKEGAEYKVQTRWSEEDGNDSEVIFDRKDQEDHDHIALLPTHKYR